jgi:small subunit ribosomal protein S18
MAKKPPPRSKKNDAGRRTKKKVSVLTTEKVEYIDYKDVNLLKRFVSDRAKVRARRVTGNDTQQQAEVARAIKNAREMALLPYTTRVTTQRNNRGRDRDRGPRDGAPRGDRDDAAAADAPEAADAVEAAEGNGEATPEEVAAVVESTEES